MYPDIIIKILGNEYILDTYPLFALIASVVALVITIIMLRKIDYKISQIVIIFLSCVIFFLIGARLLNYIINYENYIETGYSVFSLSFGHFSVYGGMIFAVIIPLVLIKIFKKDIWLFADVITIPFLTSFVIMRIGCFLNGCCYGIQCDSWVGVPAPLSKVALYETINKLFPMLSKPLGNVYPTQLMEMGFALLFLPFAIYLYKKFAGRGYLVSLVVIYFSAFRLFVLYFRDLPYSDFVVRVFYPVFYVGLIVVGVVMFVVRVRKMKAVNKN